MNISKYFSDKGQRTAFIECLMISLPLIVLILADLIYSISPRLKMWAAGLMILVSAFLFYLVFRKKFNFEQDVFFYSISFTSGCILWIPTSVIFITGEPKIPDFISTLFYALDLPSIFSLSPSVIYALCVLPFITLFYLFVLFSQNNKTNRDKLVILLLTVFVILSLILVLLLDLTIMGSAIELCCIILPAIAGLCAGYYLIYRKLMPNNLHSLSRIPAIAWFFTLFMVILLGFIWDTLLGSLTESLPNYSDIIGLFVFSFLFSFIIGGFIKQVQKIDGFKQAAVKSGSNAKVLIAFAECLILAIPLAFLTFIDFTASLSLYLGAWDAGLMIFVFILFYFFSKKLGFKSEVFFYSISFASGWILWVLVSGIFTINIRDPGNLYDIYSFHAIFAIALFYLFAVFSKNDKTRRDKLLISLPLFVFMLLSLAAALILDPIMRGPIVLICIIFSPTIVGLFAGHYLIYRKLLPSLHTFSWIPPFVCLFTVSEIFLLLLIISNISLSSIIDYSVLYSIMSSNGVSIVGLVFLFILPVLTSFLFACVAGVIDKKIIRKLRG